MRNLSLNLIAYAYATSIFAQGILVPIYAFFIQKIGGGILEAAWAVSLFYIVTGILILCISKSKWSKKYRKECLCAGWFLWLISIVMYCCIKNIQMLFVSQVLGGLGNAISTPAYDAEYSEQASKDLLEGWGFWEGITSISSGIAAVTGGFIASYFGFEVLMICMSVIATISFLLILFYIEREKKLSKDKN